MRGISLFFTYFIIILLLLFFLFPIYWMILTSVRPKEDLFNPLPWTFSPHMDNYIHILDGTFWPTRYFYNQLSNSLIVSLNVVILTMAISICGAYSLARFRYKGRRFFSQIALFSYIIPQSFLAVPFFKLMSLYGLIDNYLSLILAMTIWTSPYCIWVLREHFYSIPIDIEDAALIDGASRITILTKIVLPISAPVIVALSTYAFIMSWNEYLYALVLLNSSSKLTLSIGITSLVTSIDVVPWGSAMAQAVLFGIPPLIFYYTFERYMVKGLMAGAVKR